MEETRVCEFCGAELEGPEEDHEILHGSGNCAYEKKNERNESSIPDYLDRATERL